MSQKRKQITNHRQIERIQYIHERISSGTYPTTKELAEDTDCSTATISRDLEFMRDRCDAPYEYDQYRRGFYYTDANYQLQFGIINKAINVEVAEDKKAFSEYLNYPIELLDKLEEITDLNLPEQTQLQANLSSKYIGRNYYADGCTWIGLKSFDFTPSPLFTIAYFEPYNMNPKEISYHIQGTKLQYIAEDCSYDKGYWLYIVVDQKIIESPSEVARKELLNLINFSKYTN